MDVMKALPNEFAADKKKESRLKIKSIEHVFGTLGNILALEVDLLKKLRDCMAFFHFSCLIILIGFSHFFLGISKWPNQSIGSVLRQYYVPYFRLYPSYVNNYHFSILSFQHLFKTNKILHNFVKKHSESSNSKPEVNITRATSTLFNTLILQTLHFKDLLVEIMKLPALHVSSFSGLLQKISNDTLEEDDDYQDIQMWNAKVF
jgi:hypothetical protein